MSLREAQSRIHGVWVAPSDREAENWADYFQEELGFPIRYVNDDVSPGNRRSIKDDFRRGVISVLIVTPTYSSGLF